MSNSIKDKIFVLTGIMKNISRDEARDLIERKGGKIYASINKKTDFLVAGDKVGSKFKKAKELGVRIIDETELLRILEIKVFVTEKSGLIADKQH